MKYKSGESPKEGDSVRWKVYSGRCRTGTVLKVRPKMKKELLIKPGGDKYTWNAGVMVKNTILVKRKKTITA